MFFCCLLSWPFCCRCGGALSFLLSFAGSLQGARLFCLLSSRGGAFICLLSLRGRVYFFAVVAGARLLFCCRPGGRIYFFAIVAGARSFFCCRGGGGVFLLLSLREPGFAHSLASWVRATTKDNIKQLEQKRKHGFRCLGNPKSLKETNQPIGSCAVGIPTLRPQCKTEIDVCRSRQNLHRSVAPA